MWRIAEVLFEFPVHPIDKVGHRDRRVHHRQPVREARVCLSTMHDHPEHSDPRESTSIDSHSRTIPRALQ